MRRVSERFLPIPWNEDPPRSARTIERNLESIVRRLVDSADRRDPPSVEMARRWHREIFEGVALPVQYYAGEVRDSDPRFPELIGYEVEVGLNPGVAADDVPRELEDFEQRMRTAVQRLDPQVEKGRKIPREDVLGSILFLCAFSHGEWARIHPFANGNGRIARLWATWCAVRYGLPLFVRLFPRPEGHFYGGAAAASMRGDHTPTVILFGEWLEEALKTG